MTSTGAVLFGVGFAAWTREEADAIEAQISRCTQAAGGIEEGAWFDSAPPQVSLRYEGPDADGLEACLRKIGGDPQVSRGGG